MSGSDQIFEGQILNGKYRVVSCLGQGGMGSVFRVHHILLKRDYALKTIDGRSFSDTAVRRLQIEATTASSLDHPNLIAVHDFGALEDDRPYLVMDLVEGSTISDYLKKNGSMPLEMAMKLFVQICFGLNCAHEHGIVHRDIKPGNVMIVEKVEPGSDGCIKIVDFGIAKLAGMGGGIQSLTTTGELIGSPLYMSPEQCSNGVVDHRSDIYSLGCLFFEVLTGAPPHLGTTPLNTMMLHQSAKAPSLKESALGQEYPTALESVIAKMLSKAPEERYANLATVALDLGRILQEGEGAKLPTSTKFRKAPSIVVSMSAGKFSLLIASVAMVAAVLAFLVSYWSFAGKFRTQSQAPQGSTLKTALQPKLSQLEPSKSTDKGVWEPAMQALSSGVRGVEIEGDEERARKITFPNYCIGNLYQVGDSGAGTSFARAQGTIELPAGKQMGLHLELTALKEPKIFANLDTQAFTALTIKGTDVLSPPMRETDTANKVLTQVRGWSNLMTLTVDHFFTTKETIRAINSLSNLRYLSLGSPPPKRSDLHELACISKINFLSLYLPDGAESLSLPDSESLRRLFIVSDRGLPNCSLLAKKFPHLDQLLLNVTNVERSEILTLAAQHDVKVALFTKSLSSSQLKLLDSNPSVTEITLYSANNKNLLNVNEPLFKSSKVKFENHLVR